jgi:hypothetical protein
LKNNQKDFSMCTWNDTVDVKVPIPAGLSHTGEFRWDTKPVDRCMAPLVEALNDAGIYTSSSCCGHGQYQGNILLHDGRSLILNTVEETQQYIESQRVD